MYNNVVWRINVYMAHGQGANIVLASVHYLDITNIYIILHVNGSLMVFLLGRVTNRRDKALDSKMSFM